MMIINRINLQVFTLGVLLFISVKSFSQNDFVSSGATMGNFQDTTQPYVTQTIGQLFTADFSYHGIGELSTGIQQAYLIKTFLFDTLCQEVDTLSRYQSFDFDLPLQTAGLIINERYVPIGSYFHYDTLTTLSLLIHPIFFVTDTFLVYDSQMPYAFNDSISLSVEGAHTLILPTMHGCDSTVQVMLYVATCPTDTQFVTGYSIRDVALSTLPIPHVIPTPISVSNNAPARFLAGDTTHVLWTLSVANKTLQCPQYVYIAFPPCGGTFYAYDGDGNQYETVRLGPDCWTRKNIYATLYTDGSDIPNTYIYASPMYPDTTDNLLTYGRLYDWYSALRLPIGYVGPVSDTIQGICPNGWHIPTTQQFLNLATFPALTLQSPDFWIIPGTNETGFTALPAGYYSYSDNQFMNLRGDAYYWTSTVTDILQPDCFKLLYSCPSALTENSIRENAYSMRCVKN